MANFLCHESCPACGSRDNLGRYDDGSAFCFGCHYMEGRNKIPSQQLEDKEEVHKRLPDDTGTYFGPDSISWFSSYGFSVDAMIRRGVRFSPSKNQTIFTFPDTEFWQARNHWPNHTKYFKSGNHASFLPLYAHVTGPNLESVVVLTEDCLSAITIAELRGLEAPTFDAMPLLGTQLQSEKLKGLKRLYRTLIVWLDSDKAKEAQRIADRAKMVGMGARVISTELDPKELNREELLHELR